MKNLPASVLLVCLAVLASSMSCAPAFAGTENVASSDVSQYPIRKITDDIWVVGSANFHGGAAVLIEFGNQVDGILKDIAVRAEKERRRVVSVSPLTSRDGTSGFVIVTAKM